MFFLSNNGWMNKKTKMLCLFLKKILINRSPIFLRRFQLIVSGCSVQGRKSLERRSWCTKRWRTWTGRTSPPNPCSSTWWTWMTTLGGTVTYFFIVVGEGLSSPLILKFFNYQSLHGQSRLRLGMDLPLPPWPFVLETSPQQFFLLRINLPKNVQIGAFSVYLTHMVIGLQREGEGWILKVWTHKGVAILVTWVLSHSYTEPRFSLNHKSFFATEFISWNPQLLIISRLLPKFFLRSKEWYIIMLF